MVISISMFSQKVGLGPYLLPKSLAQKDTHCQQLAQSWNCNKKVVNFVQSLTDVPSVAFKHPESNPGRGAPVFPKSLSQ